MIEQMSDFFTARADSYDQHMINNVEGCKEGYIKMAELIPSNAEFLLDLGCGTGLELEKIYELNPKIKVTGIDLTKAMLDKLKLKYSNKDLTLINASYFNCDLGIEKFDVVISFQTMHHFSHEDKINLYSKIYNSLKPGCKYIECDYMVTEQKDEDLYFSENKKIREENNIPDGKFYHYDTPCTIDNQVKMFKKAGFNTAEKVWRIAGTTIIVAYKN